MTDFRLVKPEEFQEAVRLSDATFRDEEQKSMGEGFPNVFSPSLQQSFGAFADGKLVAFMGLVPAVLRVGAARLDVFQLGSVCTDPAYRGQGLASGVLQAVIGHAGRSGASLLLVSGGRSLYTNAACCGYGSVTRYTLTPASLKAAEAAARAAEGTVFRELEPTDLLALHALAEARPVRYDQSAADLAQLLQAEAYGSCVKLRHRVLVAERDGRLTAFAVIGVPYREGLKNPPRVIEWAGDAQAAAALFAHAAGTFGLERLVVPVPWHERGLAAAVAPLAENEESEPSYHTLKILSAKRLFSQLAPFFEERSAGTEAGPPAARDLEDGRFELRLGGGEARTLAPEELISLLFDPEPKPGAAAEIREAYPALLPVPLPYNQGLNYV
ncbi:GNAT family N-acetyltransferase [Paenibacillus sp. CC-CFT747]|nr:GNAT family N-acetyltransferase [Paenibacillus sp. CC-CFT747]